MIAADFTFAGTATAALAANSIVPVSIFRKDLSGVGLYFKLQRGFDAKYWRASDDTWQVGLTWAF